MHFIVLCFVVAFAYLIGCKADKSCGEQISDFLLCFDAQRLEQESFNPKPIKFEGFQTMVSSCFTKNGCKGIKLDSEDAINQRHGLAGYSSVAYQHLRDCEYKTFLIARPSIEKCVAKSVPGVVFPPPAAPSVEGVGLPLTISWASQIFSELRNNQTCPKSADVSKVETCINSVFDDVDKADNRDKKHNPFQNILVIEKRSNAFCKANCFSKIQASCNKTLNDVFPKICQCISSDFAANLDKYDASLGSCVGNDAKDIYKKNITISEVQEQLQGKLCSRLPQNPCLIPFIDQFNKVQTEIKKKKPN